MNGHAVQIYNLYILYIIIINYIIIYIYCILYIGIAVFPVFELHVCES